MSLKAFHIVFVTVSTLLAFGFGLWGINQYQQQMEPSYLIMGGGSLLAGATLIVYGRYVLKKLKRISYL